MLFGGLVLPITMEGGVGLKLNASCNIFFLGVNNRTFSGGLFLSSFLLDQKTKTIVKINLNGKLHLEPLELKVNCRHMFKIHYLDN